MCKSCGQRNQPGANFCSSCGNALSANEDATITFQVSDLGLGDHAEDDLSGALSDLSPSDAMLYVKRGSNVGATYLLDTDVTRAGRHPDSEVFLDDVTVSRRHAEIHRDWAHFVLNDVGSLNGTYLNGKISNTPMRLAHGDEVQIGKFKLVFMTSAAEH